MSEIRNVAARSGLGRIVLFGRGFAQQPAPPGALAHLFLHVLGHGVGAFLPAAAQGAVEPHHARDDLPPGLASAFC